MKIITTWHCTEILEGEERGRRPREWLILAGPGEDGIFEVKSTLRRTIGNEKSTAQHQHLDCDAPSLTHAVNRAIGRHLADPTAVSCRSVRTAGIVINESQ